jgi:hypothetical protein
MPLTLVDKLKTLRDARMRASVLAEHLASKSADAAVDELAQVIERAVRRGDGDAILALVGLALALGAADLVPYEQRRELYGVARQRAHAPVARLFLDALPTHAASAAGDPLAPERPLTPNGRPLTLGERKSLARGHRRELLLQLLRDPHPDVVAVLLDNPHLTEPDVVALAARRPSTPDALAHVAASQRWVPRYNVRLALVKNPYTPLPWAVRLATTLRMLDLRQVAADPNLAPLLREQAADLCQRSASPR